MRMPLVSAALTAVVLVTLAACSSSNDDKAVPSSTPSVGASSINAAGGPLWPKLDARRQQILMALFETVDPSLTDNPDRAIAAAHIQCQALDSGAANPDHLAAEAFGTDEHPLTDMQGKGLNAALRVTLCRPK